MQTTVLDFSRNARKIRCYALARSGGRSGGRASRTKTGVAGNELGLTDLMWALWALVAVCVFWTLGGLRGWLRGLALKGNANGLGGLRVLMCLIGLCLMCS